MQQKCFTSGKKGLKGEPGIRGGPGFPGSPGSTGHKGIKGEPCDCEHGPPGEVGQKVVMIKIMLLMQMF